MAGSRRYVMRSQRGWVDEIEEDFRCWIKRTGRLRRRMRRAVG